MFPRSMRAALAATLITATVISAMAACVVSVTVRDDMECCRHGFISEASTATTPECCQIASPAQTQINMTRAVPTIKALVLDGPIETVAFASAIPARTSYAVHPAAAASPPILQLSSALRL